MDIIAAPLHTDKVEHNVVEHWPALNNCMFPTIAGPWAPPAKKESVGPAGDVAAPCPYFEATDKLPCTDQAEPS